LVVAAAAVYKMNLCSGYSIEANNEATQGFSSYCLEVSFIFHVHLLQRYALLVVCCLSKINKF